MRDSLSPREREVFDAVFKNPDATVSEVIADIDGAPSASAVRTMLKRLVGKQLISETRRDEYISYRVRLNCAEIVDDCLHRLTDVLFAGSRTAAVNALLEMDGPLTDGEWREIESLIENLRQSGNAS
ncbi:BlaI/MecI/CopY family transcriptional regulator [Erythrobacter sp. JK5]|uniref:BlaI/MecI/CopY family transcriptional regulator n=1 Tax=Erythrobacter sp. JK5 TaxID=2829500 RepID=UPI001BAAD204|nr:BlaI/MecI/CopY family transcriptional regulator [Erythrobacter sp. JK5]QUL38777.1 BlaI/MecI/CopY family transcriptional regulator [Erythrobacter sp. JK5]